MPKPGQLPSGRKSIWMHEYGCFETKDLVCSSRQDPQTNKRVSVEFHKSLDAGLLFANMQLLSLLLPQFLRVCNGIRCVEHDDLTGPIIRTADNKKWLFRLCSNTRIDFLQNLSGNGCGCRMWHTRPQFESILRKVHGLVVFDLQAWPSFVATHVTKKRFRELLRTGVIDERAKVELRDWRKIVASHVGQKRVDQLLLGL